MLTKEMRIYCALQAIYEAGTTPADLIAYLFHEDRDHRIVTYVLMGGVLVQIVACSIGSHRFLMTKCAQEDDRAWTPVPF